MKNGLGEKQKASSGEKRVDSAQIVNRKMNAGAPWFPALGPASPRSNTKRVNALIIDSPEEQQIRLQGGCWSCTRMIRKNAIGLSKASPA